LFGHSNGHLETSTCFDLVQLDRAHTIYSSPRFDNVPQHLDAHGKRKRRNDDVLVEVWNLGGVGIKVLQRIPNFSRQRKTFIDFDEAWAGVHVLFRWVPVHCESTQRECFGHLLSGLFGVGIEFSLTARKECLLRGESVLGKSSVKVVVATIVDRLSQFFNIVGADRDALIVISATDSKEVEH
jgi:hypothetical protein